MYIKRREVVVPKGMKECPSCGKHIPKKEKHETVTMVVRARNHYGNSGPGQFVEVEPKYVPELGQVLMTQGEYDMLEAERVKVRPPKVGALAALVEQQFENAKAQVKGSIERGKRSLERAREQAERAVQDLIKDKPQAIDQEPPSRQRLDVEETIDEV